MQRKRKTKTMKSDLPKELANTVTLDVDLYAVVNDAVAKMKHAVGNGDDEESIREAYVASPKTTKQVTEYVSQKTKDAHAELYKKRIEALNKVSAQLDTVERSEANSMHGDFRSLKLDETFNSNSVWLHELFFANCFDPNSEIYMDTVAYMRLQRDFGTFDNWQRDFEACALSAGNGWAVCGFNMYLQRFVNTIVSNDSCDVMVGLYPIIVLDVHEHAYQRDYLNDRPSYVTAMMREINWEIVEERVNRCTKIAEALK